MNTGNMEEQNHEDALQQFAPGALNWIANNPSGLVAEGDKNQQYIVTQGSDGILQVPFSIPQWMQYQQTPQNYVEFLTESGYPEIQKEMPRNISAQVWSVGRENPSQDEHMRRSDEGHFITKFTGMEHQFGVQKQDWNEDYSNAFRANLGSGAAASKSPSEASQKRSRERAYAADRCRRLRISQRLDALQELFPSTKEGGKAALLDDAIDQVKYLQCQVKDLCQRRLRGESSSSPFIFLEGHGHYLVREQFLNGSLEAMIGKLLEFNPSAATELLQSRGLLVMPMAFAEGLREPIEMLDMQEKGAFLFTK